MQEPTEFGEGLTADHMILDQQDASRKGHRVSLTIYDKHSEWLEGHPCKEKSGAETRTCFEYFLFPRKRADNVYTDGSKEFKHALTTPACEEEPTIARTHDTSLPYLHETNYRLPKT